MISKRYRKNLCLAAVALTLTAGLGVGSAMAYFTTYATASGGASLSLNNTVTIPEEEVVNWTKNVIIQNTGETDCYVRVQVFAGEKYQNSLQYSDENGKWTPGGDGYYYYSDIVPAGGQSEKLMIHIDNLDSEDDFNVIVVQESTPVLYDENNEPYADWSRVMDSGEATDVQEGEE